MTTRNTLSKILVATLSLALVACCTTSVHAVVDLGNNGLLGNDLTDLGDNGAKSSYVHSPVTLPGDLAGFDAVFFADDEPGFNGGEFSFNVFSNDVGGGNNKWCCNSADGGDGIHVGADFTDTLIAGTVGGFGVVLTRFTITSDNDVNIQRDPDQWAIQGSDDGILWTDIFSYDIAGDSPFDDFGGNENNRTLQYDAGVDFATPDAYNMIRYRATSSVNGANHALGELEFFGEVAVPEPSTGLLVAIGFASLSRRRRRRI